MKKKTRPDARQAPMPIELIERRIYLIRGCKVMLSTHLAELYSVEPRSLIQSVKRNIERFPKDFMFQLSDTEFENLKSQFVTSSWGGLRRANPYAFTEHGVAMLSSVLRSQQAVQMNILIIRAFVKLREMLATHRDLARKIENLERKQKEQGKQLAAVYSTIKKMIDVSAKPQNPIGFKMD
jgi:phage regulator Rha-like protein